jgi:hypothetical protein
MSLFPQFTLDQSRELERLGVSAAQIKELQTSLMFVRAQLVPPPGNNEALELLRDIQKLATKLSAKLRELGTESNHAGQNSARQSVANLLAKGYWDLRPGDEGPTIIGAMCPRLDALRQSAQEAAQTVPRGKPARYKAGSLEPVKLIDAALHSGWWKEHGAPGAWLNPEDQADLRAAEDTHIRSVKHALQYPQDLLPAVSPTSAFRLIVGICYTAAGQKNSDPERAIKAYVAAEKDIKEQARVAFEKGMKRA